MRLLYIVLLRFSLCLGLFGLAACASLPPRPLCKSPPGDVVYLVKKGWHTGIGIPVSELDPNLSVYRKIFPGARVILFGFGKTTFFTAPAHRLSDYLLGPFPGPGTIQAVGLRVTPFEAYGPGESAMITLPPGGRQGLSAYIWNDLVKDESGMPKVLGHSSNPAGVFYAAQSAYGPLHTCNTWTAGALHAARLPVSDEDVVFSGQVVTRFDEAAGLQCDAY